MNAPGKTKWLHIATWSKQKSEKQFKQIKAQQKNKHQPSNRREGRQTIRRWHLEGQNIISDTNTVSLLKSCTCWRSCFLISGYHYNPYVFTGHWAWCHHVPMIFSALRPKKWPFETEQSSPLSAEGRRHTEAFSSLRSVSFFVRGVIWHQDGYNCNSVSSMNTHMIKKILSRNFF